MKKICPIHHFSYSTDKCPFCEQERIDRMVSRFKEKNTTTDKKKEDKPIEEREIQEDDLQKLLDKFNKPK